jgi:hypothetical protein
MGFLMPSDKDQQGDDYLWSVTGLNMRSTSGLTRLALGGQEEIISTRTHTHTHARAINKDCLYSELLFITQH